MHDNSLADKVQNLRQLLMESQAIPAHSRDEELTKMNRSTSSNSSNTNSTSTLDIYDQSTPFLILVLNEDSNRQLDSSDSTNSSDLISVVEEDGATSGPIPWAIPPAKLPELWVFGYGSLMWNPGFNHHAAVPGCVRGYARRFWQGNHDYRGCPKQPGRVATLSADASSTVHGLAFRVYGHEDIAACLAHLQRREIDEGYEYVTVRVRVKSGEPIPALTCIAKPTNPLFLGQAPLASMAHQIASAKGFAGPNCDYLLSLAKAVRAYFPTAQDRHLFELETLVLEHIKVKDQRSDLNFGPLFGS